MRSVVQLEEPLEQARELEQALEQARELEQALEQAREQALEVLKQAQEHEQALELLKHALERAQEHEQALELLKQALELLKQVLEQNCDLSACLSGSLQSKLIEVSICQCTPACLLLIYHLF